MLDIVDCNMSFDNLQFHHLNQTIPMLVNRASFGYLLRCVTCDFLSLTM